MSEHEVTEIGDAGGATVVPSATRLSDAQLVKPAIAGYDLIRPLGRGGMGVVWEAIEHRFERRVAIKVHAAAVLAETAKEELWAEAGVAARIGDPGIVRTLDVGFTLDGRPYYAMELVDGTDLHSMIAEGPLAPRIAIDIAADIARAVAAAHEHGVIHRDLKPRNVIVDSTGRARVLDFGIALNVRGADRYEDIVVGSPAYMAPEQALGQKVTPQSDIFSLGIILYQMLCGVRPFSGDSTVELLAAIASHEAIPPSRRNAKVHEDLDLVVLRCLAKKPEDRYATARALFETLNAIREGRPVEPPPSVRRVSGTMKKASVPPADRPRREDAKRHMAWSWQLKSSPAQLWPFVAHTDRFNRAVGLAPVIFKDEPNPEGGSIRTGAMRVMGMALSWREYPFEWIKEREHSVFRWYTTGPVSAVWNRVKLIPTSSGGTELHHEIWMQPRGVLGSVATFVEATKLGPSIDRFYRHLDEVIAAGAHADPFEGPHVPSGDVRLRVEHACAKLHADGFPSAIVEKLAMHILSAPDGAIRTLRPYELADQWDVDRDDLLETMIHAAHLGLLESAWDVVCPKCMLAHESLRDLAQVKRVGTCAACAEAFERDLRESVELVFTPNPELRHVDHLTFCAGAPALRPHVVAQQVLDPGEERTIFVKLPRGQYRIAGSVAKKPFELVVSAIGYEQKAEAFSRGDRIDARPSIVQAGEVTFVLRNETEREETIRIEVPGARGDGVSAANAMTHPSFRELFTQQLPAHGELLPVSQLAFVFVALNQREAMFETIGDAAAYNELARLDELVRTIAQTHEGTLIPSSVELLIVAFSNERRALDAAFEIRTAGRKSGLAAPLTIAVHAGRCIALTRQGNAEFFGETLHRGHALLSDCPPGGVALSAAMAADRSVAVAVHESGLKVSVEASQGGPYAGRRVTVLSYE